MYSGTYEKAQFEIEEIVDRFSMSTVISMLSEVASDKAEHIRANWQDKSLARKWESLQKVLDHSYLRVNKIDRTI